MKKILTFDRRCGDSFKPGWQIWVRTIDDSGGQGLMVFKDSDYEGGHFETSEMAAFRFCEQINARIQVEVDCAVGRAVNALLDIKKESDR